MSIVYTGPAASPGQTLLSGSGITIDSTNHINLGGNLTQDADIQVTGHILNVENSTGSCLYIDDSAVVFGFNGNSIRASDLEVEMTNDVENASISIQSGMGNIIVASDSDVLIGTQDASNAIYVDNNAGANNISIFSPNTVNTNRFWVDESIQKGPAIIDGIIATLSAEANKLYRISVSFNVISNTGSISGTLTYTDPEGFAQSLLVVQDQVGAGMIDTLPRVILPQAGSAMNIDLNVTGSANVDYIVVYESCLVS